MINDVLHIGVNNIFSTNLAKKTDKFIKTDSMCGESELVKIKPPRDSKESSNKQKSDYPWYSPFVYVK